MLIADWWLTWIMADERRASDKCGPMEIFKRLDPDPSLPLTVLTNFSRISLFVCKEIKAFYQLPVRVYDKNKVNFLPHLHQSWQYRHWLCLSSASLPPGSYLFHRHLLETRQTQQFCHGGFCLAYVLKPEITTLNIKLYYFCISKPKQL